MKLVRSLRWLVGSILIVEMLIALAAPLVSVMIPTDTAHAAGNTYYVATSGNDSADGSFATPWLTIQHAADNMTAGDTVYVRAGTYSERVLIITHSGTAGSPIRFVAFAGENVTIDGSGISSTSTTGVVVINQDYITLDGFEIANTPADTLYHGVLLSSAPDHTILKNLTIHDIYHDGILSWESTNTLIDNCEVYSVDTAAVDEGVGLTAVTNFEIKNSRFHDAPNGQINVLGSNGAHQGSTNVWIHDNEIYNSSNNTGIYVDDQGQNQSNIYIYNNKIHDNGNGISLSSEVASSTMSNVQIYNNLIYSNNVTGIAIWPYSFPKTVTVINNTFDNNTAGIDWNDTYYYNVNCVIRNNIISQNGTGAMISYSGYASGGVAIDHNLFYDASGTYNTVWGTANVTANPQFTSAPTNYSLLSTSPARDSGISTSAPTTDYIGTPRPQNVYFDIGAYEYLVGPTVTLSSISVTPLSPSPLAVGLTQQFTATGTYSDNSQANITDSSSWYSSNPVAAAISSGGLAIGLSAGGSTVISASSGGIYSNNVTLSVIAGTTPSPVPVTPPTYTSGTVTNPSTVAFGTGASPMYNVFNNVLETGDWLITAESFVQYNLATSLTMYPAGTGVQAGLLSSNNSTNYAVVSDNSDSTYAYTNSTSYVRDLYSMSTVTQYTGTITAVAVHARIASNSTDLAYVVPELYVNGNVYSGSAQTAGTSFTTKNQVWYSSPATSQPWTWTEIKALQAGASLATASASSVAKLSELSVVVSYTATDPGYSAKDAFWFEMLDTVGAGSGQIVYATLQEYGDRPIAMYLSANQSSTLGLAVYTSYQLRIRGNPLIFASSVNNSATVTLAATDYIDQSLSDNETNYLRDNMMLMAQNIQNYDQPSTAYIEDIRGTDYLSEAGANIFLRGIPYLDTMCPPLFKATNSVLDANAPTGSGTYANSLTPTAQWGATVANALTNLGSYFGINQQLAGAAILFVLGIGFAIFIYGKTESGLAVLLVIVALPIIGAWLGLMNMALAFVMIILCVVLLGYFFVARGAL